MFIPFDELKAGDTVPLEIDDVFVWGTYITGPDFEDDILFGLHSDLLGWEMDEEEHLELAQGLKRARWIDREDYNECSLLLTNNPQLIIEPRRELEE